MSEKYKRFYTEYKNRLFSYLLYRCGDREVASDIMQESFTRHFQYYGNDAAISPALLFTIARNALTDHHRYRERFHIVEDAILEVPVNEESAMLAREQAQRVDKALQTLPKPDRELLALAVGGMPYREIAEILGISEANVKVRVHRIRARLRKMLSKEVE